MGEQQKYRADQDRLDRLLPRNGTDTLVGAAHSVAMIEQRSSGWCGSNA